MKEIKPIETIYNGYRFRSRLEARWAVFFDKMGIKYEYELEGYKLPSGRGYLPDFYLPTFEMFVEVKPTEKLTIEELRKLEEFALDGDHHLLIIIGTPTNETMLLLNRCTSTSLSEYEAEYDGDLSSEQIVEIFIEQLKDSATVCFGMIPMSREWVLTYKRLPPYHEHLLGSAFLAAKQARFEHGESGKSKA